MSRSPTVRDPDASRRFARGRVLVAPAGATPAALVMLLVVVALLGAVAVPALAQDNTTATPTPDTAATPTPTSTTPTAATDAPAPAEGKITRTLTVGVIDEGCPAGIPSPCFDTLKLGANPGDVVVLNGDFTNSEIPHNLHATEGVEGSPKTRLAPSEFHTITFTMPEEGEVEVICDAHATTMILKMVHPADVSAGGGAVSVPGLGVHFLAYWVGVIAFMFLFIVYGATFFLFKYNETSATTDHWDRSGEGANKPGLARWANPLALVIAVVAVAAIVWFASR